MAIKPEVTDSKIRFLNASICHLLKKEDKMSVISVSDAVVDEYGNMSFVDKVFSDAERNFYTVKSEGLLFVN